MIGDFKEIERLMGEIEQELDEKVSLFMIGGGTLLFQGLKPATKDIDLVVQEKGEFAVLEKALRRLGFEAKKPLFGYEHLDLSQIFVREDFRIDLFHHKICGAFSLSGEIIGRAQTVLRLTNLSFSLCSKEDVFLLKTMTEREGDLEDCLSLAKRGLNWEIILDELKRQIKSSGNKVWITWVGERLDLLEDKGLNIPIMREVDELREKYFDELEKRLNQGELK